MEGLEKIFLKSFQKIPGEQRKALQWEGISTSDSGLQENKEFYVQ